MQENKRLMIVGLGNPGTEYRGTRHNVGFMAIDFLIGSRDVSWKNEKNALVTSCDLNTVRVMFVKPQTFMNNSGHAVGAFANFYKISNENIIIIHDDMDIKLGDIRVKIGGGSAGHNGIKSIDAVIGNNYKRIRIGVGHPRDVNSQIDPADWVLGHFDSNELDILQNVFSEKLTEILF